jgi:hypothetical protein
MDPEREPFEVEEPAPRPRVAWSSVVGAAFGIVLMGIAYRFGIGAAILTAAVAIIGGFVGRFYVGESL